MKRTGIAGPERRPFGLLSDFGPKGAVSRAYGAYREARAGNESHSSAPLERSNGGVRCIAWVRLALLAKW